MKRSELTVGDHLFYARPGDWDNCYTAGAHHVIVASTTPHERPRFGSTIRETDRGNGVLVQHVRSDGSVTPDAYDVVQLAHLRGPYEATLAEFEQRRKAKHAAANDRQDRQRAAQDRANDVMTRARTRGLHTVQNVTPWHQEGAERAEVSLAADELARLLDRLDELERAARSDAR